MPLSNQIPDSPIDMIVGESISFSIIYPVGSEVSDPIVTVWRDEEDITAQAMPSGSHVTNGNVLSLKHLLILDGDDEITYVIEINADVDGDNSKRKLIIDCFGAGNIEGNDWGITSLLEGQGKTYRVQFLGASKASSSVVTVYRNDEDITSDTVPSGSASESGNVVLLPEVFAQDGDDGQMYVIAVKSTVDGNIRIAKIIVTIEDPKTRY